MGQEALPASMQLINQNLGAGTNVWYTCGMDTIKLLHPTRTNQEDVLSTLMLKEKRINK